MIVQDCYIATVKEIDDSGRIQKIVYNDPVKFTTTISPVGGDTELEFYGERVKGVYKVMLPTQIAKQFHEGDLVYYGISPDPSKQNCSDSNYKISSIRVSAIKTMLYIEKRV